MSNRVSGNFAEFATPPGAAKRREYSSQILSYSILWHGYGATPFRVIKRLSRSLSKALSELRADAGAALFVRKNIRIGPPGQIQQGAGRQKPETGRGEFGTVLPRQHGVEFYAQGMQMQHIGRGISELRLT